MTEILMAWWYSGMGSGISQKARDSIRAAEKNQSEDLYLKECQLKTIPICVTKKFKNARKLVFSHNYIVNIPKKIRLLQSLEILELDFNEFDELPLVILELNSLRILNVASNKLKKLPEPFSKLCNLEELDIGGNHIVDLSDSLKDLPNLVTLSLYSNGLTAWPSSLFRCHQIKFLNLRGNQLVNIPNELSELTSLESLDLSQNLISELPLSVTDMTNLIVLNCSNCPIMNLEDYPFNRMTALGELHFHSCGLKSFSHLVGDLKQLKILDLGSNELTRITRFVGHIGSSLGVLDLSENQLQKLPGELSMLDPTIRLELAGNRLKAPFSFLQNSIPELFNALVPYCHSWPDNCTAEGDALTTCIKNEMVSFNIISRDYINRKRITGGDRFDVFICDEHNPGNDKRIHHSNNRIHVKDLKNGSYEVFFNPSQSGTFKLFITCDSIPIYGSPYTIVIFDT